GLSLSVDNNTCTAPCSFLWAQGSSHTIAVATSPQSGGSGIQYVYSSWSDTGAQSHTITTLSTATTYMANFTTQYQVTFVQSGIGTDTGTNQVLSLTVNGTTTNYNVGNLPPATWYNSGTLLTYTYSSPVGTSPASGKQYAWTNTTPPSPLTVNAA